MGDDSICRSTEPRRRASEIIEDFLAHTHGETIAVSDLAALLGDRAFGMLLLLLALPNVIPLPGLSTAVGVPMIV
ncbi:exopolysaccharide biosynthesis protein, partial [bacterium]|nr:exopolysaccharide biosynthesis protein [bacterium]